MDDSMSIKMYNIPHVFTSAISLLSVCNSSLDLQAFMVLRHKQNRCILQLIRWYFTNSTTYIVPLFILKQFLEAKLADAVAESLSELANEQ